MVYELDFQLVTLMYGKFIQVLQRNAQIANVGLWSICWASWAQGDCVSFSHEEDNMEWEPQRDQIRAMTNFWQFWLLSTAPARTLKYRSQWAYNSHTLSGLRNTWVISQASLKLRGGITLYLDVCSSRYQIRELLPLHVWVFTLSAMVAKSSPFDLMRWSAHMRSATTKGHIQNSRSLNFISLT